MNKLEEIIDEHFLSSEKAELIALFNKYNIIDTISKTTAQLKTQLQNSLLTEGKAPITAITTSSSNFLIAVNHKILHITNPEEKQKVQQAVAKIGIRILLSIIKLFPNDAGNIFREVQQSLQITAELFGYDYNDIKELVNFEEFDFLIRTLTGKQSADEISELTLTKSLELIWTRKCEIGFLTTELKKRKWIKSQNEFSKLFSNKDSKLKVHWDMQYKYELALLLFMLKEGDFIRPRKGYFQVAEKYIVDFSGKAITKNSLKKISSKITTNDSEYRAVIDKVNEIIKTLP